VLWPDFPIDTARLRLRPFEPRDLEDVHAYHSRPDVARYLYWQPRDRAESRDALLRKTRQGVLTDEGNALVLAVEEPAVGRVVGEVLLEWRSRRHRQGEVGFVFNPDFSGRGYATEAAAVMLRLGFAGLGLHRIVGRCDARNAASARVLERLGMRREAHFRHNELFKGEWGDELVYALLDEEWRATG
jgi:RimJ/RimL family protein N-acetyltransferase